MSHSLNDKDTVTHCNDADEGVPELDQAIQERLGRILAAYSQELVTQPVPDIFLSLLAKLEAKERLK